MQQSSTVKVSVQKINAQGNNISIDTLAVEEPLEIRLEFGSASLRTQKNISVTMRTPGNDEQLAAGFLLTEGIINEAANIQSFKKMGDENILMVSIAPEVQIDIARLERHFYTSSSCGVCGKSSIESIKTSCSFKDLKNDQQFEATVILQLPALLRKHQNIFEQTGSLHAAALFSQQGELIYLREDVGRHNALDKLIGVALLENMLPLENKILLLSGRTSFELVQKAAMAGIKLVAAVGAPSSLAVETAKSFDICVVGFLRDERFNIYSGAEKILTSI